MSNEKLDTKKLISRFEAEMSKVKRPGVDKLMDYIRHSDFYTAPASTKYHLSCEGGLLQHSLNVLDAFRDLMHPGCLDNIFTAPTPTFVEGGSWYYSVAGNVIATISDESAIIVSLLHDICKTHFYTVSTRNVKNEKTGKWEKVPYYTIEDKMPLGHGAKSAMIIKQYMELTTPELYAIWWHMGFADLSSVEAKTLNLAIGKYPLIWALHTADMMASHFMEEEKGNHPGFDASLADPAPQSAGEYADAPATGPQFEDAPPLTAGA